MPAIEMTEQSWMNSSGLRSVPNSMSLWSHCRLI